MREPRDLDALCGPLVRSNVEPWYRDVGPRADIRSVGWSSALNEPYRCIGGPPEFHFAHPRSLLREGGGDGSRPKHARSPSSRPSPAPDVRAARAESTARAKAPPTLLARAELRERAKLSAVALARCRVGASFDDTIALQRLAPAPDADRTAPSTPPSAPPNASLDATRRRPASARPASASASPSLGAEPRPAPSPACEPRGDIAGFRHHAFARRERARPATAARNRTPAGTPAKTRPRSALHTLRRDAWTRVARGEEAREDEAEDEDEADDAEASREHSPGRAAAGFATAMRTIRARTRPASANDASTVAARRFATTAPATAPPPPARSRLAFGSAPIFPATTEVLVRANFGPVRDDPAEPTAHVANPSAAPSRVASRPRASAAWTEAVFGVASPAEASRFSTSFPDDESANARASRARAASDAFRVSSEALDDSLSLELELLARERSSMARAKRRSMARSDASGARAFPRDCSREMRAARYLAKADAAREALARVDASGWYDAVYEHLEARVQDGGRPTRAEKAMVEALSRALAAGRPFEAIEFRRVVVSVAYRDLLDHDAQALIRRFVDTLGVSREAYESWFAPWGRVKTRELMREFDESAGASTRKTRRARGENRDDARDEGRQGTGDRVHSPDTT